VPAALVVEPGPDAPVLIMRDYIPYTAPVKVYVGSWALGPTCSLGALGEELAGTRVLVYHLPTRPGRRGQVLELLFCDPTLAWQGVGLAGRRLGPALVTAVA
jgi:hypothetical protein